MSEQENKVQQNQEIDLDELEQVSGGANPFADVERVKLKEIDQKLRDKI